MHEVRAANKGVDEPRAGLEYRLAPAGEARSGGVVQ